MQNFAERDVLKGFRIALVAIVLASPAARAQQVGPPLLEPKPQMLYPAPQTPAPAPAGPQPADPYEQKHGHAHAHLCDTQRCDAYCGTREGGTADLDKMRINLAQCISYCMKDCR
jgi:hypothetical protein